MPAGLTGVTMASVDMDAMANPRILVVDDDESLLTSVTSGLQNRGFAAAGTADGLEGLTMALDDTFDVVVLDIGLPGMDGLELCKKLRSESSVLICLLTGRTDVASTIEGLEAGADDYVRKPFHIDELAARLRALLRRGPGSAKLQGGGLVLDPISQTAAKGGRPLRLSITEFKLLSELMRSAGTAMPRDELLQKVWGYGFLGDSRLVDMAIKRLRSKIEDDPHRPKIIQTVRGSGYRFSP